MNDLENPNEAPSHSGDFEEFQTQETMRNTDENNSEQNEL